MTKQEKEAFLKSVHTLADGPTVRVRFVHFADGKEHVFCSTFNKYSGHRLSWFDSEPPTIDSENGTYAHHMIRGIYKKSKVISHENAGGFNPPKKGN